MTTATHRCPVCHAAHHEDDCFCEQCGAALTGGPAPASGDRTELDLESAAAISDRGLVHRRNEDAFYLELSPAGSVAAVVCDGTSSASAGNAAAREAAAAAGAVLSRALAQGDAETESAIAEAIREAQDAVAVVPWTTRTRRVDPSCTLVSALCREGEIAVGSVGDSRAYWVDGEGLEQLTVDDSFAAEGVARGLLTPEQAANSPFLHSITHWVGPNSPERPPNIKLLHPERPGRLLLCTDGLWNYAPTVPELAELLGALPPDASPRTIAAALVDAAVSRGGLDNITVAVVDVVPHP